MADSRGASLAQVHLLGYRESVAEGTPYRLLASPEEGFGVLGLAIESEDPARSRIPAEENWILKTDERERAPPIVEFEDEVGGVRIAKSIEPGAPEDLGLAPGAVPAALRHARVVLRFTNESPEPRAITYRLYGPAGIDSENTTVQTEGSDLYVVVGAHAGGGRIHSVSLAAAKLPAGRWERNHTVAWIGASNNYFASVLFPLPAGIRSSLVDRAFAEAYPDSEAVRKAARTAWGKEPEELDPASRRSIEEKAFKNVRCGLRSARFTVAPGETVVHAYGLYLGSREASELAPYEKLGIEGVNQYGTFGFLVRLFMGTLKVLKSAAFGSWGVAIVLLTLLVRLCLYPINRRSQASVQRFQKQMQSVKPEMDELKAKYGSNRAKMNAEMQKLWKKHGINPAQPMAGCLVLFLQLPIWWGLYSTLQYSIGLRQAGFLWIRDLTRPDELLFLGWKGLPLLGDKLEYLNLLPILYVILTVLQQRAQPKPDDPQMLAQYRTMTFMMVIFGFIFYKFPAGFMLYIMTSAGLSIIESRIIKAKLAREGASGGGAGSAPGAPARAAPAGRGLRLS
ncbi:MAG: YidC/Oxa1 family membrane protein insertase, partial [Planctomycetota bacterium]